MWTFKSGRITIDDEFYLSIEDAAMCSFLSIDMYGNLLNAIEKENQESFVKAVREVLHKDTDVNMATIRLLGKDNKYHWMLAEITSSDNLSYEGRPLVNIKFVNPEVYNKNESNFDNNVEHLSKEMAESIILKNKIDAEKDDSLAGMFSWAKVDSNIYNVSQEYYNNNLKDQGMNILNKRAIIEYAKNALDRRENRTVYLAILDLDNFKNVNDSYGHMEGDRVLITVGEIMKEALGHSGVCGRIGGDEMMLVIDKVTEYVQLRNILRNIRTNIEWEYKKEESNYGVTCSIGVATFPDYGQDFESLFNIADRMLYLAKSKGKNRYIIYIPEIHDAQTVPSVNINDEKHLAQLRENKLGSLQHLISDYLVKNIAVHEVIFSDLGYGYDLDEILFVYNQGKLAFSWTRNGVISDVRKIRTYNPSKVFDTLFDQFDLLVIDGLYKIESKEPELLNFLKKNGTESVVFYRMHQNNQPDGYVMFGRKNHRMKWSENEITVCGIMGKVIELALYS